MAESKSKITSMFSAVSKVVKHITVEPLMICYLLPFLTTYAAIENMNLEKACRELVTDEIGFEKDICKLFVRKDEFGIKCAGDDWQKDIKTELINEKFPEVYSSIGNKSEKVFNFLCESEDKVQKKLSKINSIRNPISSIGPLIIVLFAGPWSDKKNLRVPCMIVPYLGETVAYFCKVLFGGCA
jgi:PCFT/HCP family folate transporter-like MFS transporter 1/3